MPRVSESHRAGRRAEILAAATRLFAANGFHNTSMADVIAGSGLSAGAVYTYFRSKEELIGAVAERALETADGVFETLLADRRAPSPAEAVTVLIEAVTARFAEDPVTGVDLTRIAVQIWSEALRSPDIRNRAADVVLRLRAHFAELARRRQAAGLLSGNATPDQVGAAMLGLVQGYMLQRLLIPSTDAAYYGEGLRELLEAP